MTQQASKWLQVTTVDGQPGIINRAVNDSPFTPQALALFSVYVINPRIIKPRDQWGLYRITDERQLRNGCAFCNGPATYGIGADYGRGEMCVPHVADRWGFADNFVSDR